MGVQNLLFMETLRNVSFLLPSEMASINDSGWNNRIKLRISSFKPLKKLDTEYPQTSVYSSPILMLSAPQNLWLILFVVLC